MLTCSYAVWARLRVSSTFCAPARARDDRGQRHEQHRGDHAADRAGDEAQLADELRELVRVQRLRAVRQRAIGGRMHLDDDAIGASGQRGPEP